MNRRIVLARRPQGAPVPEDFRLETHPVPSAGSGTVLLRTRYLSLDPYMRGRMNEGPSYAPPVALGAVMTGQTVSVVEASAVPGFAAGDLVVANVGWQDYGISDGRDLVKIDPSLAQPSCSLGVLGMPGLTAYVGLLDIGQPQPGETVVVPAATGAVGSVVGQIAKIKGCRVVGIAGGTRKCAYARGELGFDDCLDHHSPELPQRLAEACAKGIDVYFESVGGAVLYAVIPLLNVGARVPLCGLISWYNLAKLPEGVDRTPQLLLATLRQRVKIQGFIIFDHYRRMAAFQQDMSGWLREGRVRYREELIEGLESAPRGLIGLLQGENFGKLIVRVSRD
ncbi:MAG TPA: NADP-dependent oxidoreductase [Steroidobacteraceae bacterium]|jgi:NADPH-dependent curcumin reductase CurA|nr:NADP-dependent oxidoreductase [Steroidobacteraceae bacterium]